MSNHELIRNTQWVKGKQIFFKGCLYLLEF